MQLARRGQVRSALVVQGCVIWSSNQLLSELARGWWGVCPARLSDVPIPQPSPDPPGKGAELAGGSLMAGAHPPLGRSGRNGSGRNGTTRRTRGLAHVGSRSSGRTGGSTVDEGSTDDAAAAIAEGVALWTECWSRRAPLAVEACPGGPSPLW